MGFADRFTVESVLAERGAVTTKLVRDAAGTRFVMKTLSVRRVRDAREIEHFEREVGILKHLVHPAIPRFVESAVEERDGDDVRLHLLQGFVPGRNLVGWIAEGRGFTPAEARRVFRSLADVLAALHETSPPLVHRDVKPQNVMMNDAGDVFLVDFGAARRAVGDGTVVGTFGYMAPEQAEGRAVPASDVFGVGMTMVFLLTHREPSSFADDGGVRKAWRAAANVDDDLASLIDDCLSLDDTARPADGAALRARIDALGRHSAREPVSTASAKPTRSGPAVVVVLVAVCAVVGVVFGQLAMRAAPRRPTIGTAPTPTPSFSLFRTQSPSERLGVPGVLEATACLDRAARALQSEERYRSWRTGDAAPTCSERYLMYGLYELYDDAPGRCGEASQAAAPSSSLQTATTELQAALAALTPIVKAAAAYYQAEDWKDDACAQARALHEQLLPGFRRVRAAFDATTSARRAVVRESPPPDDADAAPYRRLLDAALAVSDPMLPPGGRKDAVERYLAAVAALPKNLTFLQVRDDALKKWARDGAGTGGAFAPVPIDGDVARAIDHRFRFNR
jgi:hypothetical protein